MGLPVASACQSAALRPARGGGSKHCFTAPALPLGSGVCGAIFDLGGHLKKRGPLKKQSTPPPPISATARKGGGPGLPLGCPSMGKSSPVPAASTHSCRGGQGHTHTSRQECGCCGSPARGHLDIPASFVLQFVLMGKGVCKCLASGDEVALNKGGSFEGACR